MRAALGAARSSSALVQLQLIGAHRAEGERIEDEDRALALRSCSVKRSPSARAEPELGAGVPGARTRHLLLAQAELFDSCAVALEVLALEVVEEAPAAPDEHQQAAARVVVFALRRAGAR